MSFAFLIVRRWKRDSMKLKKLFARYGVVLLVIIPLVIFIIIGIFGINMKVSIGKNAFIYNLVSNTVLVGMLVLFYIGLCFYVKWEAGKYKREKDSSAENQDKNHMKRKMKSVIKSDKELAVVKTAIVVSGAVLLIYAWFKSGVYIADAFMLDSPNIVTLENLTYEVQEFDYGDEESIPKYWLYGDSSDGTDWKFNIGKEKYYEVDELETELLRNDELQSMEIAATVEYLPFSRHVLSIDYSYH